MVMARFTTEDQFLRAVTQAAKLHRWKVWHPWISLHSAQGYPDLTLVRDGQLILAELKRVGGTLRPQQVEWAEQLQLVADANRYVAYYLWTPADWDFIEQTLAHGLV
jgi:hypothetical protein